MKKYVKEIYSTKEKGIVDMYDSYLSTKGKADEAFVKNLYEVLCSIIRLQLKIDNVLALCKSNVEDKLIIAILDHKHEQGNYYVVKKR